MDMSAAGTLELAELEAGVPDAEVLEPLEHAATTRPTAAAPTVLAVR